MSSAVIGFGAKRSEARFADRSEARFADMNDGAFAAKVEISCLWQIHKRIMSDRQKQMVLPRLSIKKERLVILLVWTATVCASHKGHWIGVST